MKTIHLKISDKVYDKFLLELKKFKKEDIQVMSQDKYLTSENYSEENEVASFVSEEILENPLKKIVAKENQKDWFTEMTKKEQQEIKIGLEQADKGDFITNQQVMKRFNKWH